MNYSTRAIIFGPAYGTANKNNALFASALFIKHVPGAGLFSNEFLADLERIWALRYYIPDPNRPDYCENI